MKGIISKKARLKLMISKKNLIRFSKNKDLSLSNYYLASNKGPNQGLGDLMIIES
jgi:hypothetical protein